MSNITKKEIVVILAALHSLEMDVEAGENLTGLIPFLDEIDLGPDFGKSTIDDLASVDINSLREKVISNFRPGKNSLSPVEQLVSSVYAEIRHELIHVSSCADTVQVRRKDLSNVHLMKTASEEGSLWKVYINNDYVVGMDSLHDGFRIARGLLTGEFTDKTKLKVEALNAGKNPTGIRFEVEQVGDRGIYQEIGLNVLKGEDSVAYMSLGITDDGEPRFLSTEGGNGYSDNQLAVYPCRELDGNMVDMKWGA